MALPPNPKLAPHLREALLKDVKAERQADQARLTALLGRQKAVLAVYASPEYQGVLDELRETLEEFRDALEHPQPEPETIFLRGQARNLRRVLALPQALATEIAELEARLAEPDPGAPPTPEQDLS